MSGRCAGCRSGCGRGLAIAVAYTLLLLAPVLLGLIVVPPFVSGAQDLARQAPTYAQQARDFADKNRDAAQAREELRRADAAAERGQEAAQKVGTGAATTLGSIGVTLINSIFAGVTILILSIFLVADGGAGSDAGSSRIPRTAR